MVGKLVLLKLGDGSLEQGFPVMLQFGEEGQRPVVEIVGRLPAALELQQAYRNWVTLYRNLNQQLRLEAETQQLTNVSKREDCYQAARILTDCLNVWLYADSFRPIREKLLEQLMPSEPVRLILQTDNPTLRRLPWHLWDFCDRYPKTEIALGAAMYDWTEPNRPARSHVNILAILGNSRGIDTQTDRRLLERLAGAEVSFLVEPTRQELTQELWRQSWDILFFAGHSWSQSGSSGQVALSQDDSLSLDQLRYALRRIAERGLQIAIFNSCDGLGLARELEDLRIPQIVVMREPVPDKVAQEFLKSFLAAFAQGQPFHLAVREAREILQGLEDEYPCATWLPVICQNPAAIPPTWRGLGGEIGSPFSGPTLNQSQPAPISTDSLLPQSKLINDRYQIQRVLGQGGFGRTYLAADSHRFGDLCVLKQFAPLNRNTKVLQRSRELFEREAKVLYQVNHPQIPKFLAWFTYGDQLFIVEEYIDGETYLTLLEERRQRGETFSEPEIIQWMKELLPVLDYLHSINIIHRDISPGNVILPRQRSQPVLIDFGIVKEVASQIWSQQIGIQPASRVGKPGYASPEQMQLGQCYPCSDLYGLGMTALVLLTGRNPRWLLEQRFLAQPQTQISPPLVQILQKLLAENPRHRYASARSVLDDLNLLSAGQPGLPVPVSEPPSVTQALPEDTFLRLVSEPTQPSEPGQPSDALLEQFIQPCHRELVRCVGPMASYLLEDILTQQPQSPLQLIELLAAEIPDARQSTQFKQHAQAILKQLTLIPSPPIGQNAAQTQNPGSAQFSQSPSQHSGQPVANLPSPASTLTPEMIRCCRQELARQIGPMAICIVDDILAQSPQPTVAEFVQAVAAEIPEPKQAEAFRRQLIIQLEQLK